MLGLANFINSDLTWKGSKGYRSSSRLVRNSVSRSSKGSGELFDQKSKSVNMPICESEKLGVKVLGCRFSENVEHVPIKKRRFVYRSPSPPPRAPSPHSEETDSRRLLKIEPGVIDSAAASASKDAGQIVDSDCDVDEPNLKRVKGQVDENVDFSGISILAAAADGSGVEEYFELDCSTNNESFSLPKGLSKDDHSSAKILTKQTGLPSEDLAACLRTDKSSASDLSHEETVEGTSLQDHPVASNNLSTSKDEKTVRKGESFSRDDRSYWDLNTPLDSWGHPFDYQVANSNTNVIDGIAADVNHGDHSNKMEGYELCSNPDDCKADAGKEMLLSDCARMTPESSRSNIKDLKLDVCVNSERSSYSQDSLLSSELDCAVKADQGKQKLHGQGRTSNGAGAGSFLVPIDEVKRVLVPNNEDKNSSQGDVSIGHANNNDGLLLHEDSKLYSCADDNLLSKPPSCYTSGGDADENTFISSGSHVEKEEVASLIAFSGKTTGEVGDSLNKAVDDDKEIFGSLDETRNATDIVALETQEPLNTRYVDIVREHHSGSGPLDVEITKLAAAVEAQPALAVDLRVQYAKASVDGDAKTDALVLVHEEEPATKCIEESAEMLQAPPAYSSHDLCRSNCDDPVNSYDDMSLEEPLDNDCYSDVSHDCARVKLSELEVDYDSQYEDGEVRESIIHTWEEYDGEDVEAEHVDYGSDDGNSLSCEAEKRVKHTQETILQPRPSSSSGSGKERSLERKEGKNEVVTGHEAGLGKVTEYNIVARKDGIKKPSLSADSTAKVSGDHSRFSDAITGVVDGSNRKKLTDDCMDAMDTGSTKTKMLGSREFRRGLRSHIEGRELCDMYLKDKMYKQGSSDANNSNLRSERETGYVPFFGRLRYTQHPHARDEEGDCWVNSSDTHRALKRYYSPNYHRPTSFRHPGAENGYISRQKIDASSLNVHWRLTRSGLPVDRDEAFRLRLGFRPSRELSPDRRTTSGRGRSLRYDPRPDVRGLTRRYHGPIPDDFSGSSLTSHPSAKRERSFSPIERRGKDSARKSHSKSPLRSRTRSPNSANPSSRHRSKSPNLRSEVRMQRGRSPYQQFGIEADRMVGFKSVHRFHSSLPHNSRWTGDWKNDMIHFRERNRFGPRDERFEFVCPPRNYRSMDSGRFPDMEGLGRGRPRFDRSDDNRERHGYNRFGLVPPAKRYEMDGAVKQFRYNGDEGFVKTRNSRYGVAADFHGRGSPKEFGRSIECSVDDDVPRRFREERGLFIHQRDGKHNANSKSFGMRENDDHVDSSRRPS